MEVKNVTTRDAVEPERGKLTRRSVLQRSVALLAGAGALSGLLACTGGSLTAAPTAAPAKPTASGSAPARTVSSPASQPASGSSTGNSQLVWLVPEDPLIDKYAKEAIIPAFEKQYSGVKVQAITPGSTAYGQKLLTLVAAGQVPDVFCTWGGSSFFLLWNHKLLGDLTPHFQSAKIDPSYIQDVYRGEYSVEGHLYGVPWNSNPTVLVYNKSIFDKYGVPLPPSDWKDKTWTVDKLVETAKALTHTTGNPSTSVWGLTMGAGTRGSLAWLWGADPFNDKGGPTDSPVYRGKPLTAVFPDRPEIIQAMSWLADLTLKHHVSPTPTDAQALSSYGNPIFSGHIAIAEQAAGWLERQAAVVQPKFDWGVAPFPYGPAGVNTSQREDTAWYLASQSKNADAAFNLIVYATQGQGADDLITVAKDNPPIKGDYFTKWSADILKIHGFAMNAEQFTSVFQGGIAAGFGDPQNVIDNALEYMNAFNQLMAPVWLGKISAQEGLKQVKAKWEEVLKTSGTS